METVKRTARQAALEICSGREFCDPPHRLIPGSEGYNAPKSSFVDYQSIEQTPIRLRKGIVAELLRVCFLCSLCVCRSYALVEVAEMEV